MPLYTKLDEHRRQAQVPARLPQRLERSWALTPEAMAKDLAFFDALKKKLTADYKIDAGPRLRRRHVNGGYMAHFIGKERSKEIAAVACHSGALGLQTLLASGPTASFR